MQKFQCLLSVLHRIIFMTVPLSETKRYIINKHGICELPYELPNILRLRILGKNQENLKPC